MGRRAVEKQAKTVGLLLPATCTRWLTRWLEFSPWTQTKTKGILDSFFKYGCEQNTNLEPAEYVSRAVIESTATKGLVSNENIRAIRDDLVFPLEFPSFEFPFHSPPLSKEFLLRYIWPLLHVF